MNNRLVIRGLRYPGDIAIENGVIADIGLIEPKDSDQVVTCAGDIATPGLIFMLSGENFQSTMFMLPL